MGEPTRSRAAQTLMQSIRMVSSIVTYLRARTPPLREGARLGKQVLAGGQASARLGKRALGLRSGACSPAIVPEMKKETMSTAMDG